MINLIENIKLPADGMADLLIVASKAALKKAQPDRNLDLTIVIDTDIALKDLNKRFRDIDSPTDVLSFESNEQDPETGDIYIGDIIISLDQATKQAEKSEHSLSAELQLLTVHGVLHLLGYDHSSQEEKSMMWALQKEILTSINSKIIVWPED